MDYIHRSGTWQPPCFIKREPPLFHNQLVFHRFDTTKAAGNLSCLIDNLIRIDRTA